MPLKPSCENLITEIEEEMDIEEFSQRTIDNYLSTIRDFLSFTNKPPGDITMKDVRQYQIHLKKEKNLEKNSRVFKANILKYLFKFLKKEEIQNNIKIPGKEKKERIYLTEDEIKKLINAAKNDSEKLILNIIYSSGVRVSEFVTLRKKDINFDDMLALVKGKGNKERTVILSNTAIKQLLKYAENINYEDLLFPITTRGIQKMVTRCADRAKIKKKVSPHILRHSFATHLLEHGEGIRSVQSMLGHASIATTEIYTHISQEYLRTIAKRHPHDKMFESQ